MSMRTVKPSFRRLRGYAVDPSLSLSMSTMDVNELVYKVEWEDLAPHQGVAQASYPSGDYLEIIDYDPAGGKFYDPVNLDDPYLLAQDGLAPSVSNPEFHQQMVYAVIMTTIKNFEQALGRKIQWAETIPATQVRKSGNRPVLNFGFVRRLRVYPHALRQANAYYDPNRKALLFGYFEATPSNPQLQLPGATVFTCLSHDIVAHETSHAILDGLHRRYINATHPDTRAFHEAFSDIVALLQHFSFPEVLRHQIRATQGDLKRQNILGQLAQEFGRAIGGYSSLRDAIGSNTDGHWTPKVPDPSDYVTQMEPHERGSILVAAVFDAFLSIYQVRVEKLLRIATQGSGILPAGALHPDLVDEMASKASQTAREVLRMCIRALDYCPPMDLTFGDYLRAILTADFDLVAEDERGFRVAFVEAFQKRGINSPDVKSMAIEELLYPLQVEFLSDEASKEIVGFLRNLKSVVGYLSDREEIYQETKAFIRGDKGLHRMIERYLETHGSSLKRLAGLLFFTNRDVSIKHGMEFGYNSNYTSYAISNVWLANRVTPNGSLVNQVVVTLAQKRGVGFKLEGDDWVVDESQFFIPEKTPQEKRPEHHIIFGGGCTLIFDLDTLQLRYAIKKDVDDRERMVRQFRFEHGMMDEDPGTYFDSKTMTALAGPFAFIHSHSIPK